MSEILLRLSADMIMVIARMLQNQFTMTLDEFREMMKRDMDTLRNDAARFHRELEQIRRERIQQRPAKPKKEKTGMLFLIRKQMEMKAKLDTMELTLKNKESEHTIQMNKRDADFAQQVLDRDADFKRKLRDQQAEFEIKEARLKEESERTKRTLEETHKLKLDEVTTLTKLESEQKIAKAQLVADQKVAAAENAKNQAISELKAQHAEAIAKVKQDEAQQHYTRMTDALSKMNSEGSIHMKNFHEMTMSLLEHSRPGQTVNETRLLTGSFNGEAKPPKTVVVGEGGGVAAVVTE